MSAEAFAMKARSDSAPLVLAWGFRSSNLMVMDMGIQWNACVAVMAPEPCQGSCWCLSCLAMMSTASIGVS